MTHRRLLHRTFCGNILSIWLAGWVPHWLTLHCLSVHIYSFCSMNGIYDKISTYRNRYAIFLLIVWKFDNEFWASFFFTIVEGTKTAHHFDAILRSDFTFRRHNDDPDEFFCSGLCLFRMLIGFRCLLSGSIALLLTQRSTQIYVNIRYTIGLSVCCFYFYKTRTNGNNQRKEMSRVNNVRSLCITLAKWMDWCGWPNRNDKHKRKTKKQLQQRFIANLLTHTYIRWIYWKYTLLSI